MFNFRIIGFFIFFLWSLNLGLAIEASPLSPPGHELNLAALGAVELTQHGDFSSSYSFLEQHHKSVIEKGIHHVAYRGGGLFGALGGDILTDNILPEGVAIMKRHRQNQYLGSVGIGTPPQFFDVIFDTGSTNFWIVDDRCIATSCLRVPMFHREKSSTFHLPSKHATLDITFGTGEIVGTPAYDTIKVGPFQVPDQAFNLVESEIYHNNPGESNVFDSIRFQGILGLAFPAMSGNGRKPLYDNLLDRGLVGYPNFSFYITPTSENSSDISDRETDGQVAKPIAVVLFGGDDPSLYVAPLIFVPVVREYYWEVRLKEFWVGEQKLCCNLSKNKGLESYVIFDTGTTFNSLPARDFQEFSSLIPMVANCSSADDEHLKSIYPTLTYVLENDIVIKLTPDMYLAVATARKKCIPAYMQLDVASEFGHAYVLGSHPFMRFYYTSFKRGLRGNPSSVGVARSKDGYEGTMRIQSLLQLSK